MHIRVKVIPNSSKNSIELMEDKITYKVKIKSLPEKGKANKELIEFLSKHYKVEKSKIVIKSGKQSQIKLIQICKEY
ncbi:DUF167 domain-containing protein [bacterium]|jgi:uncharacterized protein|nr:DUF167 domain-containing protein [bacterium]MBT6293642.1 DUF167 domain-containing protein [bacterium]